MISKTKNIILIPALLVSFQVVAQTSTGSPMTAGDTIYSDIDCSVEEVSAYIDKSNYRKRTVVPEFSEFAKASSEVAESNGEESCFDSITNFDVSGLVNFDSILAHIPTTDDLKDIRDSATLKMMLAKKAAAAYAKSVYDTYKNKAVEGLCKMSSTKYVKDKALDVYDDYHGADQRKVEQYLKEQGIRSIQGSFADQVINKQQSDGLKKISNLTQWNTRGNPYLDIADDIVGDANRDATREADKVDPSKK